MNLPDLTTAKNQIYSLDLDDIAEKVARSHPDWTQERLVIAVEEYRRFLILVMTTDTGFMTPTIDLDEIWHQHILYTERYAADCQSLFGTFLHHSPQGGHPPSELRRTTLLRYRELFGADPQGASELFGPDLPRADTPT